MIKVLFVCHGNICRSPMAEYVLRHLAEQQGLAGQVVVDSAATSTEELGHRVHPGTRRALGAHGIACGDHRARQIGRDECDKWDLVIAMDDANVRNIARRCGEAGNVYKLMAFAGNQGDALPSSPDAGRDVADPWYTGDFEVTFNDVLAGCEGILRYIATRCRA